MFKGYGRLGSLIYPLQPTPIISDTPTDLSVANSPAIYEFTYICEERCIRFFRVIND